MDQATELRPYKINEAAELIGVSEQVVRLAVRAGRLPAFRIGKSWLIPREQLTRLVRGESITQTAA